jgi:hypothetical protein
VSGDRLGPVEIGLREVYDQVVAVGGLVQLLVERDARRDAVDRDHEDRIRRLERARWPLPSLAALLAVASLLLTVYTVRR